MPRFVCCLACAGSLVAQQFAPSTAREAAEIPPGHWSMIALADCDGDGDQDVAANPATGSFAILRQGPARTWTTIPVLPNVISAAVWTDFDGDGDRDVLVGATNVFVGVPFGILRNDGATFTWLGQSPSVLLGTVTRCLAADVNGDSLPDTVLGVTTGVQIGRNLGNNTIGPAVVVVMLPNARPDLFDGDGDGDLDLVVASTAGVRLFDNAGGTFIQVASFAATGTDVAARDFDADGRVDLALVNGGTVDVLWNRPNGWQLAAAVVPIGTPIGEVLAGDLDRDNDLDLVVRAPPRPSTGCRTRATARSPGGRAWRTARHRRSVRSPSVTGRRAVRSTSSRCSTTGPCARSMAPPRSPSSTRRPSRCCRPSTGRSRSAMSTAMVAWTSWRHGHAKWCSMPVAAASRDGRSPARGNTANAPAWRISTATAISTSCSAPRRCRFHRCRRCSGSRTTAWATSLPCRT
jgi:hypothetical protein